MLVESRSLASLKPYSNNPRCNSDAVAAVAASIREFGWNVPIVCDEDLIILAGHTRLLAARELGLETVPVYIARGLTPAQAKAFRVADNKTAPLSGWDDELLIEELLALQGEGFDLALTGFSDIELTTLLCPEPSAGLTDPDSVPEQYPQAITQPGDLWLLGEHRLLCGNSTKAEDVARLMEGKRATMMFTDPPWNVAIGGDGNPRHRQRPGLVNDNLPPEQFASFLHAFAGNAARHVTGDVYVVLGASEWPTLDRALRTQGFHWSATVIWVKDAFVLGRSKYHRRYEPLWYGWHRDGKSSFQGRRDLDDVWEIPRPKQSPDHPTTKPTELVCRAIEYSSAPGDTVLDPFGGSGSTLISAEQLGRQARLMELEPHYCDVIARRWAAFTGRSAVRDDCKGTRAEHRFAADTVAA